jgi:DNA polymerase IV
VEAAVAQAECDFCKPMAYRSPTDITDELWKTADEMLCQRLPTGHLPVRLVGMGVSGFDNARLVQGLLFDQDERKRQAGLDVATDQIRKRFGSSALRRAASLPHREKGNG